MAKDFASMPLAPNADGFRGHDSAFRKHRLEMLQDIARDPRPMLRLKGALPNVRACIVNDAAIVSEMLVEKAKSFHKSDMYRYGLFPLAGEGIFTANGAAWQRQRRMVAPLFQPQMLERYAVQIVECTRSAVESWREGTEFSFWKAMMHLAMDVAGTTLFGTSLASDADELGAALTVALESTLAARGVSKLVLLGIKRRLEAVAERLPPSRWTAIAERGALRLRGPLFIDRKTADAIGVIDARIQRMIEERRRSPSRSDVLGLLLEARDERGLPMSDRQVRDEAWTYFVAGHETTATALAWTMYSACKHPEVRASMEREADAIGEAPSMRDLPALETCGRTFREALRLYPPLYMFSRENLGEIELGGYALADRTTVYFSPWVIHHNPRFWIDPERFDCDRHLPGGEASRNRQAWLPFGAGPRICVGNHFAQMEAQLALAIMLRRWRFELSGDDEPIASATLRPKYGVRMRVHAR